VLVPVLFADRHEEGWKYFGCIIIGLVCGIFIGEATEYFTSYAYKPTFSIMMAGKTGPATAIIQGPGIGMLSCVCAAGHLPGGLGPQVRAPPHLRSTGARVRHSKHQASARPVMLSGLRSCTALAGEYGVAIAAVGMLSTLGIMLATDAYGPVLGRKKRNVLALPSHPLRPTGHAFGTHRHTNR